MSTSLPPGLVAALAEVGHELQRGGDPAPALTVVLGLMADLDPDDVVRADGAIANSAQLWHRPSQTPFVRMFAPRPSAAAQLLRTPGLEYLFIFHRDGRAREAALLMITGALPTPFLFAAVLWRLNDWAEPVRRAAARCAARSFPQTDPAVVARAAAGLLVRQATWGRWRDERAILDEALDREDVAAALARLMVEAATGPQASVLRHALRKPGLDRHLHTLFAEAVQPSVRAVALATLINGEAEWPAGTAWRWIDKTMGLRRRMTVFEQRPLTIGSPREALISRGLGDRSAVVRKVALSGIIRHLLESEAARASARPLVSDRSKSVREKAEFILKYETS